MNNILEEKTIVDVILPNFNKEKFLEESINSVVLQTFQNWKMYIIDDNSTDNSLEIIKKFSNLKNITIIKLKKIKARLFVEIMLCVYQNLNIYLL